MKRGGWVLLIVLIMLVCIIVAVTSALVVLAPSAARPIVQINSPRNGEQFTVGQETLIQAIAHGAPQEIKRIGLWVDGQLLDAQTSNVPGGISPFHSSPTGNQQI